MVRFIDAHRDVYGVESICAAVPIAPSTYFLHRARHADPTRRSARAQRDDALRPAIQRVWDAQFQVYGFQQYLSIRYTERLAEAALSCRWAAEVMRTITPRRDGDWLVQAEVIRRRGPWRSLEAVEFATLAWVDWFNTRRLFEPIGYVPRAEFEAAYYQQTDAVAVT